MFLLESLRKPRLFGRGKPRLEGVPPLLKESIAVHVSANRRVHIHYARGVAHRQVSILETEDRLYALVGYARAFGQERSLSIFDLSSRLRRGERVFGGQYLIVVVSFETGSVQVLTTLARLVSGYYAQSSRAIMISTRQAPLAAAIGDRRLDLTASYPFGGQGYVSSERSVFSAVGLCEANSLTEIHFSPPGVRSAALDDTLETIGQTPLTNSGVDALAGALARAFRPIADDRVKVGITGGRDSRLIAAALTAAGAEFESFTRGSADDPADYDVVAGRMVANAIGVAHKVSPRAGADADGGVTADLMDRLVGAALNSDFSVFGYESISAMSSEFRRELTFNGGGGELLRVAYGSTAWRSPDRAEKRIMSHAQAGRLLRRELRNEYSSWLESWVSRESALGPAAMLKKFSLLYRTGRWGSGLYAAAHSAPSQRPYYDNEVLRFALPIRAIDTATDVLYYELLLRLAPCLVEIPFGTRPWALVESGSEEYAEVQRSLPAPLSARNVSSSAGGAWNWRRAVAGPLGDELVRVIKDAADSSPSMRGLIDANALDEYQRRDLRPTETIPDIKRLWAAASLGLTAMWADGQDLGALGQRLVTVTRS